MTDLHSVRRNKTSRLLRTSAVASLRLFFYTINQKSFSGTASSSPVKETLHTGASPRPNARRAHLLPEDHRHRGKDAPGAPRQLPDRIRSPQPPVPVVPTPTALSVALHHSAGCQGGCEAGGTPPAHWLPFTSPWQEGGWG